MRHRDGLILPRTEGRCRFCAAVACLVLCLAASSRQNTALAQADAPSLGQTIADHAGVSGGVAVFLGWKDVTVPVELARKGHFLVHLLYSDDESVTRARRAIQERGLYGTVSADRASLTRLPYVDNLMSAVVADDLPALLKGGLSIEEIARVLRPNGWMCLGVSKRTDALGEPWVADAKAKAFSAGMTHVEEATQSGTWVQAVKPRPANIDEWTHWLHGADGNAVAEDTVVAPPRHVQWVEGPRWSRHHDTVPSVTAMVSAAGRLFTLCDEAPAGIDRMPDQWSLIARDAFSGVLLWKRPIAEWGWAQWSDRSVARFNRPQQIPRRLVAAGDRVYVTLGYNAPLTALDAATGKTVTTYAGTEFTDEILYLDGTLLLSVSEAAQKPRNVRAKSGPVQAPKRRVLALNAATGKTLWEKKDCTGITSKWDAMQPMPHLSLAAGGGRVFYLEPDALVALDLADGSELWRAKRPTFEPLKAQFGYYYPNLCTLVARDDVVLLAQPQAMKGHVSYDPVPTTLMAFDAATGRPLWTHDCGNWGYASPPDVFVAQDLVWVHLCKPFALAGIDPKTGEVKGRFPTDKALRTAHHHRCYRNKATERYVLTGRRGIEFIDLANGEIRCNHWVRGTCRFGIVPCNGLVYAPPHPCVCYITAKLTGLYALAGTRKELPGEAGKQLEKGSVYAEARGQRSEVRSQKPEVSPAQTRDQEDWAMYRHDAMRSGVTAARVGPKVKRSWQAQIGGKLTAPVVADGKVFVASVDDHRVHALSAENGTPLWHYTAGGRVDTPPTIHNGLALFGSADGCIYCLRASDGALVWHFRAGPTDRRLVAFGRLESVWPVHGGVLVKDGVAYACAGRSSFLDGGMRLCALDPATGKVLGETRLFSPDPDTGEMADCRLPYDMPPDQPGALPDVLMSDGTSIYLRHLAFDHKNLAAPTLSKVTDAALRDRWRKAPKEPVLHLLVGSGFLDDTWFNQTYWTVNGRSHSKLLVFDRDAAYGVRPFRSRRRHGRSHFRPGGKGYVLFSDDHAPKPPPKQEAKPAAKEKSKSKSKRRRMLEEPFRPRWSVRVPVRVRAMALAGRTLFIAGAPDVVDPEDPWASFEGRKGALLWAVSADDGKTLSELKLDALPAYDGLAAAPGRLYLSTKDGKVTCFADSD